MLPLYAVSVFVLHIKKSCNSYKRNQIHSNCHTHIIRPYDIEMNYQSNVSGVIEI